jgi:hypothetical protein
MAGMILYQYKIYCETDSKWECLWLESTESAPTQCPVNTGHTVTAGSAAVVQEVDNSLQEVVPHTPANEHTLTPIGLAKHSITRADYCGTVNLSNKSTNTFDYASFSMGATNDPVVGGFITDDAFLSRYEITAVDTGAGTLTVDDATGLANGNGKTIVHPYNIDFKLPSISDETKLPYHMLWGVRAEFSGNADDDFARCQIVDVDNIVGYGAGAVLSFYDETWVRYFDTEPLFRIPDNSPGPINPGLYLRMVVFCTTSTGTLKAWTDYLTTLRDA